jgi:hypothetical protein
MSMQPLLSLLSQLSIIPQSLSTQINSQILIFYSYLFLNIHV